jgi:outer membrane protein insertion porin family
MILLQKDQVFSQILMTTTAEFIKKRLGNEGYTFAKVDGKPERNDADKTVKVTFLIEPGKRAYVNRINFFGNTQTVDEVLRREMRQMEGGSASNAQIDNSKVHLERLGFFKEVKVETKEVAGTTDKVDVEYTVEEQPTGSMNLSIGYSQYSKLMFQAGIQKTNWFGTGKSVGFSFSKNFYSTSYNLNYTDPYFTPDGVSRGFSLYYSSSKFGNRSYSPYTTNTYGGKVTFGYPISEIERIGFDIGLRNLEVTPAGSASQEIIRTPRFIDNTLYTASGLPIDGYITRADLVASEERKKSGTDYLAGTYDFTPITDSVLREQGFLDVYGDTFNDMQMKVYWLKSTLNRGVLPDRGASQRISAEITVPGGDLQYYTLDYDASYFQPLTQNLTLKLHGRVGYGDGYGSQNKLPFFENFRGGGFGSVRGFEDYSLGPRATVQSDVQYVASVWDDINGDGTAQENELSRPAAVLLESGKIAVQSQLEDYGRRRGAFGGNTIIEGSAEILFPLPFLKDQRSVQAGLFLDVGNVFDTNCGLEQRNCFDVKSSEMKASVGVGLTWISSFGPMTFSLSEPLSKENSFDDYKVFQFSLGQTF